MATALVDEDWITALTACSISAVPCAVMTWAVLTSPRLRALPARLQVYPTATQLLWSLVCLACVAMSVLGLHTTASVAGFGIANHFLCMASVLWYAAIFMHLRASLLRPRLETVPPRFGRTEARFNFFVVVGASVLIVFPTLAVAGVTALPQIDPRLHVSPADTYTLWSTGIANLSPDLIAWRVAIFSGPATAVLVLNAAITLWAILYARQRFPGDAEMPRRIAQRAGRYLLAYALMWSLWSAEDIYLVVYPGSDGRLPPWLSTARAALFHLQGAFTGAVHAANKWHVVRTLLPPALADAITKIALGVSTAGACVAAVPTAFVRGLCSWRDASDGGAAAAGSYSQLPSAGGAGAPPKVKVTQARVLTARQYARDYGSPSKPAGARDGAGGREPAGSAASDSASAAAGLRSVASSFGSSASEALEGAALLPRSPPESSGAGAGSRQGGAACAAAPSHPRARSADTADGSRAGAARAGDDASVYTVARSVLHSGVVDAWEIAQDAADAIEAVLGVQKGGGPGGKGAAGSRAGAAGKKSAAAAGGGMSRRSVGFAASSSGPAGGRNSDDPLRQSLLLAGGEDSGHGSDAEGDCESGRRHRGAAGPAMELTAAAAYSAPTAGLRPGPLTRGVSAPHAPPPAVFPPRMSLLSRATPAAAGQVMSLNAPPAPAPAPPTRGGSSGSGQALKSQTGRRQQPQRSSDALSAAAAALQQQQQALPTSPIAIRGAAAAAALGNGRVGLPAAGAAVAHPVLAAALLPPPGATTTASPMPDSGGAAAHAVLSGGRYGGGAAAATLSSCSAFTDTASDKSRTSSHGPDAVQASLSGAVGGVFAPSVANPRLAARAAAAAAAAGGGAGMHVEKSGGGTAVRSRTRRRNSSGGTVATTGGPRSVPGLGSMETGSVVFQLSHSGSRRRPVRLDGVAFAQDSPIPAATEAADSEEEDEEAPDAGDDGSGHRALSDDDNAYRQPDDGDGDGDCGGDEAAGSDHPSREADSEQHQGCEAQSASAAAAAEAGFLTSAADAPPLAACGELSTASAASAVVAAGDVKAHPQPPPLPPRAPSPSASAAAATEGSAAVDRSGTRAISSTRLGLGTSPPVGGMLPSSWGSAAISPLAAAGGSYPHHAAPSAAGFAVTGGLPAAGGSAAGGIGSAGGGGPGSYRARGYKPPLYGSGAVAVSTGAAAAPVGAGGDGSGDAGAGATVAPGRSTTPLGSRPWSPAAATAAAASAALIGTPSAARPGYHTRAGARSPSPQPSMAAALTTQLPQQHSAAAGPAPGVAPVHPAASVRGYGTSPLASGGLQVPSTPPAASPSPGRQRTEPGPRSRRVADPSSGGPGSGSGGGLAYQPLRNQPVHVYHLGSGAAYGSPASGSGSIALSPGNAVISPSSVTTGGAAAMPGQAVSPERIAGSLARDLVLQGYFEGATDDGRGAGRARSSDSGSESSSKPAGLSAGSDADGHGRAAGLSTHDDKHAGSDARADTVRSADRESRSAGNDAASPGTRPEPSPDRGSTRSVGAPDADAGPEPSPDRGSAASGAPSLRDLPASPLMSSSLAFGSLLQQPQFTVYSDGDGSADGLAGGAADTSYSSPGAAGDSRRGDAPSAGALQRPTRTGRYARDATAAAASAAAEQASGGVAAGSTASEAGSVPGSFVSGGGGAFPFSYGGGFSLPYGSSLAPGSSLRMHAAADFGAHTPGGLHPTLGSPRDGLRSDPQHLRLGSAAEGDESAAEVAVSAAQYEALLQAAVLADTDDEDGDCEA